MCLFYFIFVFQFLLWFLFNFYLLCAWGAQGEPRRIFKKMYFVFSSFFWFLLLKQTSIAIFAMTLPCSAVFYRYENVVKCKACVSSIRERADKNQQRSTNHDSLFAYLLLIQFLFVSLFLFFTDVYGWGLKAANKDSVFKTLIIRKMWKYLKKTTNDFCTFSVHLWKGRIVVILAALFQLVP